MADSPTPEQLDALVTRWATARSTLSRNAGATLLARWAAVNPYEPIAVARFAAQAAQISQGAQDRSGQLVEAYLRSVLTLLGVRLPHGVLARPGGQAREGVDLATVYARPAATVRYARSRDVDEDAAAEQGRRRLLQLVDTDVMLASRNATRQVLAPADQKVIGWRRVLRPELATSGSCGLCAAAADRLYKRGQLMAVHDGCHCVTVPVTRTHDLGAELNKVDLEELYAAAGGTDRAQLRRVQIAVRQHGELGPVLTDAEHSFRGPDDVAA